MNEERWNAVRQFYMESFGIAPELVDLMASNEVLLMCVSGSSTPAISRLLNIDEESVSEILTTIFDFPGWAYDLDYSPYNLYREDPTYLSFVGAIREQMDVRHDFDVGIEEIDTMFSLCEIYARIEERLEMEWS
jgi:hypothetical protein